MRVDPNWLKAMRGNTLSVLRQISIYGKAKSVSMQAVRQALVDSHSDPGIEGSSNLFYYLFDDWRSTLASIDVFYGKLEALVSIGLDYLGRLQSMLMDHRMPPSSEPFIKAFMICQI
jgi:hypothetical protein